MKYPEIKELARKLRNNPTKEEAYFWKFVRKRQLEGRKFLRQHPIIYQVDGNECYFYIPDFYCATEKLVIEFDGPIHKFTQERDQFRDQILTAHGLRVVRFSNSDLADIQSVLDTIRQYFRY